MPCPLARLETCRAHWNFSADSKQPPCGSDGPRSKLPLVSPAPSAHARSSPWFHRPRRPTLEAPPGFTGPVGPRSKLPLVSPAPSAHARSSPWFHRPRRPTPILDMSSNNAGNAVNCRHEVTAS
ncbi:hypothetical protein NHX12_002402 [Muraenolepis orangiensis]|uniref:Uncharacterized protein n=1 Tax=Muraenolepis orangiensis TaxID=630683 RepID=A0A9Q0IFE3_9TELE|nr:hypothetical protein NHX12_002402 [Muraenolepis orangiensis]